MTIELTESMQNYLKRILMLEEGDALVSTQALAGALQKTPASVTGMLKKLAEARLVDYERYQGVRLTSSGRKIALEMVRHHRLLERYLTEALGYSWDQVHDEAERLEHHISEEFEERIDAMLGYPATDPHGAPIPRRDGTIPHIDLLNLYAVAVGQRVEIARVADHDPDLLKYLSSLGLALGTAVEIVRREPFDGPLYLRVRVDKQWQEVVIGAHVARAVDVYTPPTLAR